MSCLGKIDERTAVRVGLPIIGNTIGGTIAAGLTQPQQQAAAANGAGGDAAPPPPPPPGGATVPGGSQTAPSVTSQDYALLNGSVTIENQDSANSDSASRIAKIHAALDLLNSNAASFTAAQADIITNINKFVYTTSPGRSGIDLSTGTFTISQQDLDGYSISNLATDISHDAYHIDQYIHGQYTGITYTNGVPDSGASMQQAVQLEKDATNFQLAVGRIVGLDATSTTFLTNYAADQNHQIEARLGQAIAIGGPATPPPPPSPGSGDPTSGYMVHVRRGQTASEIAYFNNVSLDAFKLANPDITDINSLDIGQGVNIPAGGEMVVTKFSDPIKELSFLWNNFGATDSGLESRFISLEGYRTDAYLDSGGILTVGIGHKVLPSDNLQLGDVISNARVEGLFQQDAPIAYNVAANQAASAGISDPNFIVSMMSVNYQLGTGWTKTFRNTWSQIVQGNYNTAADMFNGTLWQKQTPVRVTAFQDALRALPPKQN